MLIKATEQDKKMLLDYCNDEPSINLFIVGDIELYGFDSEFQDVWYQMDNGEVKGIILKYHDNFILYSKDQLNFEEIIEILGKYQPPIISGKASIMNRLYELVKDHYTKRVMNFAELISDEKLTVNIDDVKIARVADARDIAIKYGDIDTFRHLYSDDVNEREKQIANRISSLEGIHMFIKINDDIISHGNTAAETETAGMIGGVFTVEDFQRRGYAKKVVTALSKNLINRKKRACLFYSSEASEKLFKQLGFKDIDQWVVLGGKK